MSNSVSPLSVLATSSLTGSQRLGGKSSSWYEAMAEVWGKMLNAKANEIEVASDQLEHIKEELADVLIYTYMLADNLGLDINQIIREKLVKNAIKYPAPKE